LRLRKKAVADVEAMGFEVLPSETNFFMMHTGRPAAEVRNAFREKGVAVGRDFPPMLDWLRVSIGTEEEMERFMTGLKEIF
jgi:histidinol-phosphate aminotransferase